MSELDSIPDTAYNYPNALEPLRGTRGRAKDISGLLFGRLIPERILGRTLRSQNTVWGCRCACGNRFGARVGDISTGAVVSCGCFRKETNALAAKSRRKPGSVADNVRTQYIRGAEKRGHSWLLSEADFYLITAQDCHYCGAPPQERKRVDRPESFSCNGIDRVDNDLGYEPGNVVACCFDCNRAKSTMTRQSFLNLCTRVAVRHGQLH